jgi:hypothetical protein
MYCFYKTIVHEIINCNKSKFRHTNNSYFYDLSDRFPVGTLLDDVLQTFQQVFPSSKISFKDSYHFKNNSKIRTGILVEKLKK